MARPSEVAKPDADAEQFDRHPASCWGTRIASQPLLKVETIMCALCTGEGRRRGIWIGRASRLAMHLQVLTAQLYARSPMKSSTPVTEDAEEQIPQREDGAAD